MNNLNKNNITKKNDLIDEIKDKKIIIYPKHKFYSDLNRILKSWFNFANTKNIDESMKNSKLINHEMNIIKTEKFIHLRGKQPTYLYEFDDSFEEYKLIQKEILKLKRTIQKLAKIYKNNFKIKKRNLKIEE